MKKLILLVLYLTNVFCDTDMDMVEKVFSEHEVSPNLIPVAPKKLATVSL